MSKETNAELKELYKIALKVRNKSLKNRTLDVVVQSSISTQEPDKVKYSAMLTSPAKGVQPITYVFGSAKHLKEALEQSVEELSPEKVEVAFHENMLISLENRIQAHKDRLKEIEDGNFEVDDIEMEEV